MAWKQAYDILQEQKKETGDALYHAINNDTEISLDASMIQGSGSTGCGGAILAEKLLAQQQC